MEKLLVTAGVDIGGTNTGIGLIDENGRCIFEDSIPTQPEDGAEVFISRLCNKIKTASGKLDTIYLLSGIGIAAPGANYFRGTIESASNLKWGNINFIGMMNNHFDIPIAITNDANAAALGEQAFGAARGMKNFIVITLGTGLGSGIVVNGELLYGENGLAGELGHTVVIDNGRRCNCGRTGCLETYVSANGLKRTVFFLLSQSNEESLLRYMNYHDVTAKLICDLAIKKDKVALEAFEFTGEILGKAIANVTACFDCEAVVLFGGLANAGELLMEPTQRHFEKNLLSIYKGKVKILSSGLKNGRAAILGASSLIMHEIRKQNPDSFFSESEKFPIVIKQRG